MGLERVCVPAGIPGNHSDEGLLGPGLTWIRWDLTHLVPDDFGEWALKTGLHSKGSDFTSENADFRRPGASALRRIWSRTPSEKFDGLTTWVLFHESKGAIGVVAIESLHQLKGESCCLGRVSIWMTPCMRGRGLMGALLSQVVSPSVERAASRAREAGAMPYIRASDAAVPLMRKACVASVLPFFSSSNSPAERVELKEMLAQYRQRIIKQKSSIPRR